MKKSFEKALEYHFLKYRKMTPQDTVKLIFQSEYGGGHLIADESYARARLCDELENTIRDESVPTVEYLGDYGCRVNLQSVPTSLSPKTLAKIFAVSAGMFHGDDGRFMSKLTEAREFIDKKYTSFGQYEYNSFLEKYFAAGGGAVHHSIAYASAYSPAYRVIHTDFAPYIGVFAAIDEMLARGGDRVIIDGRCGSGKTTLAGLIASVYGCGVVHADDFYPESDKSPLDFDRMNRELNADGDVISYGVYDCSCGTITDTVTVNKSPFLIIEGSYTLHPSLDVGGDLRIFLTVSQDEQLSRITARCPGKTDDFKNIWIPREEEYFRKYSVENSADIVVKTDE